jgi:hypothetical protein
MTPSYFRAAAANLLFFAATASAQPPMGETQANPDGPRPVVLLLDDYKIVAGTYSLDARGNYVRAGDATSVIAARRVLFVGTSAPEVKEFLATRAKEVAAKTARPPAGDFNRVAANAFPTKVQPLLTNLCASCHAKPDYAGTFKLKPIPPGYADADAARANLAATAAHLNRADPSASDLLTKSITAHGGQKAAALPRPPHPAHETLALWAHGMAAADGSATPTAIPTPKPALPPAVFVSKPRVNTPMPAGVPPPVTDPFDPATFNRDK